MAAGKRKRRFKRRRRKIKKGGTRSTFIKPFHMDRRASTITIITANTVARWDEAALRKGRIHSHLKFDQVKLSDG